MGSGLYLEILKQVIDQYTFNDGIIFQTNINTGNFAESQLSFGLGVEGSGYLAEIALANYPDKLSLSDKKNLITFSNALSASNIETINDKSIPDWHNPLAHGFAGGFCGALLFEKLRSYRTQDIKHLNDFVNRLCDLYLKKDLETISATFYGGLSGLQYFLIYLIKDNKKFLENKSITKLMDLINIHLENCIEERNFYQQALRHLSPKQPLVGLAWGITGISYAILLSHKYYKNKPTVIKKIKDVIDYEKSQIKGLEVTNNDSPEVVSAKNSLCYGNFGLLLVNFLFSQYDKDYKENVSKLSTYLSKSINNGNYNFCCAQGSQLSIMKKIFSDQKLNIKLSDTCLTKLDTSILNTTNDLSILSGVGGAIYQNFNFNYTHTNQTDPELFLI